MMANKGGTCHQGPQPPQSGPMFGPGVPFIKLETKDPEDLCKANEPERVPLQMAYYNRCGQRQSLPSVLDPNNLYLSFELDNRAQVKKISITRRYHNIVTGLWEYDDRLAISIWHPALSRFKWVLKAENIHVLALNIDNHEYHFGFSSLTDKLKAYELFMQTATPSTQVKTG